MTHQKQNLAIATALGYRLWHFPDNSHSMLKASINWPSHSSYGGREVNSLPEGASVCDVTTFPNWAADHNAAVGLCDVLAADYHVCTIDNRDEGWRVRFENEDGDCFTHTAPTLAGAISGAFLKAKGLWREEGE